MRLSGAVDTVGTVGTLFRPPLHTHTCARISSFTVHIDKHSSFRQSFQPGEGGIFFDSHVDSLFHQLCASKLFTQLLEEEITVGIRPVAGFYGRKERQMCVA